ncbi:hypothetical protein [Actinophytocola sp. NPDC049390]|uniref:hypothetical protein n=1 Tax=Actinophytocola sp. NPDC049390 TaxID=3363894 RepID=UPI00378F2CA0
MADEQVVISVADDQVDDMSTVVDALRAAGLRVSEVLESAGVVTGTVDGEALASLSTVPGVADVERSRVYEVPPPDSPVQ